ncbi:MAG: imidazoleglycerol-phosphate dehydratase HisB [Erysipelotrichaceae bacterium]
MRKSEINRKTKETEVMVKLDLDGSGKSVVNTGVGFLDHMLRLMAFHAKIDLNVEATGDIDVDDHHLIEDVGITLGTCLLEALGKKEGIQRYSTVYLPMDEALARVCIDISGRSYLVFNAEFNRENINGFSTEMVEEFLRAVAFNMKTTLHVEIEYGTNDHHKIEAIFKGFGKALKEAIKVDGTELPSTKGII